MSTHETRMILDWLQRHGFVSRRDRFIKSIEGNFRIDDYGSVARQADDHVGPSAALFTGDRLLLSKITVLQHARQFDYSSQLNLSPTPADVRGAQGLYQIAGFSLKLQLRRRQGPDLFAQFGISAGPRFFHLADLAVNFLEGLLERFDELIDRPLPKFQIALRVHLKPLQSGAGQIEK